MKSVGLTGGDAFFPTGTDVELWFETDTPGLKIKPLSRAWDSISIDYHQGLLWETLEQGDPMDFELFFKVPFSIRIASNGCSPGSRRSSDQAPPAGLRRRPAGS